MNKENTERCHSEWQGNYDARSSSKHVQLNAGHQVKNVHALLYLALCSSQAVVKQPGNTQLKLANLARHCNRNHRSQSDSQEKYDIT